VPRLEYPLKTGRLVLRPYREEDLDALYDIQCRPDVARYLYWSPRSRREVREALTTRITHSSLEDDGDGMVLAVLRRDTGELIGDVNLMRLSREHGQGEIGFVFHPDHHGRGFATEAAEEMLRLGFETLRMHRIIGRCDARNTASAGVMQRLGMRKEAHFKENELVKGHWCDEYIYALLADEWSSRHT
jgi:RimJ/RimL family protein N-acetyltransferase